MMFICLGLTVSTVCRAEYRYPFTPTDAVDIPHPHSILPVARATVHAGRHREALEFLQLISRFNGSGITIDLEDVDDRRPPEPRPPSTGSDEREPFFPSPQRTRPIREIRRATVHPVTHQQWTMA